ncbi:MAG TPA: tripartite tricarboxylate transporter TctB family protein [Candidatus Binatia bacterium]|nr:tripartite tricarboxylate transporter TctB family protein [Candidatus Binatia bacterium]
MTTDRFSAIALGISALLVIWNSRQLPLGTLRQPGPAFIPILLASLLLIFAVLLVLTSRQAPSLSSVRWTEWRHALAILAASLFSVFAMERLGYRLTVLLVLSFLVKLVEQRGWIVSLSFAFTLSFASFFLFYTVLRVPLPQGPFGF